MAGEFCDITPTVNRRKSVLYQDIYNFTGKNRALTNLLYAASLTDAVKQLFDRNDFNSQGEIKFKSLREKLNLDSQLTAMQNVKNERVSIGATNSNGDPIAYDNPNAIKNVVLQYNDTHEDYHAKIKHSNGKYYIDLDVTDASNYKSNVIIRELDAKFNAMQAYLHSIGIDPVWSQEISNTVANFRNYRTLRNIITSFVGGKEGVSNMSKTKAQVFLEAMLGTQTYQPLAQRILNQFGENTAQAIADVSSGKELEGQSGPYWTGIIRNLLNGGINTFRNFDIDALINRENNAVQGLPESSETILGANVIDIDDVMNDLDQRFHIRQDFLDSVGKKVKSLSDAANKFMIVALRQRELLRKKSGHDKSAMKKIKSLTNAIDANQRLIDAGEYANSISSFLGKTYHDFNSLQEELKNIKADVSARTDDLKKMNVWSQAINRAITMVEAYQSVVDELSNIHNLDIDQTGLPDNILQGIEDTAFPLSKVIRNVSSMARSAQFEIAYMFLQKFWGSSDTKIIDGRQISLREVVETLKHDVNFVEKLLFSMNESTDEALGLFYEAVKENNRKRDAELRTYDFLIRVATDNLYKAGGRSSNVYIYKDGVPQMYMKSEIDWLKYEEAKQAHKKELHDRGVRGDALVEEMRKWEDENTERVFPFTGKNLEDFRKYIREYVSEINHVPADSVNPDDYIQKMDMPKAETYGITNPQSLDMDDATREYYLRMLALRNLASNGIPFAENDLFKAIQLTADLQETLVRAGGNPMQTLKALGSAFADLYTRREDDTDFGDDFNDLLAGNNIRAVASTLDGKQLMQIPLFFTHALRDQSRVTTDMSKAMSAFVASAVNYVQMSDVIDVLTLTQDYLSTQRGYEESAGPFTLMSIFGRGRNQQVSPVEGDISKTGSAEWLSGWSLSNIYNQRKNRTGELIIFGKPASVGKAVDTLTGLTSIFGLTTNFLGAEANLLVGQIQMFIESQAKEFFLFKNWIAGDAKYAVLLPEYLSELSSNNKKAMLTLLGERFDVMEDYYQTLKENGFKTSLIGKIMNNAELMFLYGAGEHLLHNQTMLAILDAVKIWDTQTNSEAPLFDLFKVREQGANGILEEQRDRYKWIVKDENGEMTSTREIEDADINKVEKQITYCNKTMHGAFAGIDKGMIHRYAFGRMLMNFRQWMPAHYARRFNKTHYDADLGEYRRGYYVSAINFVYNAALGLIKNKTSIAASWEAMSEMDRANVKRAIAEVETLVVLSISMLGLGDYKDKKGNWAYRNLMYQMKRMLMEVKASTPVDPFAFLDNIITMLNSPFAALNTIEKLRDTLNVLDMLDHIEGGKYDGENRWVHNLKKNAPFIGQISKQIALRDNDDLFKVFEKHF